MQNQQTPQVLAQPFCAQGDKNTIPNAATGTNKASLQEGFPPITGQPINQGGIPPERQDFNGAMNLNSQFYFAFQNGWWPTFSQDVSDAIGGYPQNAILCYFVPASNSVQFVRSLIPNNTYNFVTTPSYIGQYWVKCLMESAGLPMGAVYYSQSALTSDNPGAVPAWQGVFEQNGSQTYPEFFSWITSHTELCITKTEYDSDITTYGECPFYVLNETSAGNLRFPQLVNYIKNANSTDGITQSAAGLPDHSHAISQNLYAENGNTNNNIASGGNTQDATLNISTGNASASNSIYGASDTVTPAHTTLYPWIVVNPSATSISQCVLLSQVGTANGVASLDDNACVPFAQMPAEVVDNIDIPFDPSAYGWPDIRPAARPNSVVLLAGVKSDYSAYDNLGFKATCEGGYNVFIDGVQYGTTYASGAQCSITWSQYSATTGFSVAQPQALTAHIVQIVPAVAGNNITAFQCARVASSSREQQGVLWFHFNLITPINASNLSAIYNAVNNPLLTAVTCRGNTLKVTGLECMLGQSQDLTSYSSVVQFLPVLDLCGQTMSGAGAFNTIGVKKIKIKNGTINQLNALFANNTALQRVETEEVDLLTGAGQYTAYVLSNFLFNARSLQQLPNIDMSYCQEAYPLISNAVSLKDTYLDLGYASQLKRLGIYGYSGNVISGLKQLLVSQQAPFDYASAPQINVEYTGLDQNALVALFNSLPYNVGYTVVGSPTIQDGVVSGFSTSSFLEINKTTLYDSFELTGKFKMPSSLNASYQYVRTFFQTSINCGLCITPSGKACFFVGKKSDGGIAQIESSYALELGQTYTYRMVCMGDMWYLYLRKGAEAESEVGSLECVVSGKVLQNQGIGVCQPRSPYGAYGGSIFVSEMREVVNGKLYFNGSEAMDKTINITGAAGASALTAEQLAIATDKGWTVTR